MHSRESRAHARAQAARRRGPWTGERILRHLEQTRVPLRLACNGGAGHPVLASLWFLPEDGRLWCATQRGSSVVAHLRRDARCAFEVAEDRPPYRGVRGQGLAALDDARGPEILRRLIGRYLGDERSALARWLLGRAAREIAIGIEPRSLLSWDFSERMGGG